MKDDAAKPVWNSLEITKVVVSAITPMLIFILGLMLTESVHKRDEALKNAESQRIRSEQRQAAVLNLSRFIYERRARAEMLASSLRRNVSLAEIVERKKLYDDAYVKWNTNHQANLLLIRQVLDEKQYSEFDSLLEFHLVGDIFAPLDACLTSSYDRRLSSPSGAAVLDQCSAKILIQAALDCGYAFTDELFKLSDENSADGRAVASKNIEDRCRVSSTKIPL